ncbi:MerR family transcriptional regulator [Gracilibacillus sp. Marseille-QA3620]
MQTEYDYSLKAIETVKHLLENKSITGKTYSHKSAASILHLTEVTLRNWERNHVYTVERNPQNRRLYIEHDMQKILIIRILRRAHFSITSIAD